MPAAFSGTLRSLQGARDRQRWFSWIVLGLIGLWASWMLMARIQVYEVSMQARLEVNSLAHVVAAPVEGRVTQTTLSIGREVQKGEVLLVLDSQLLEHEVAEHHARQIALRDQTKALKAEILAEEQQADFLTRACTQALRESKEQMVRAEADVNLYQSKVKRFEGLAAQGAASLEELEEARAKLLGYRAARNALSVSADRLQLDRTAEIAEGTARIAKLKSAIVRLSGETDIEDARIALLQETIDQKTIRAPVGGRIGELGDFNVGSVIARGQPVATIVPDGSPRAVAYFPASSVGRIRPGQSARLRFDRFPWTQYGSLSATVRDAGNEPKDGKIRVELRIDPDSNAAIPIQHGLSGTAEVEIEQATPLELVLRAVGERLHGQRK